MTAIYAGSFSPPTKGHLDVIERASRLFDRVIVAVMAQRAKTYTFSPEERLEMLRIITAHLQNVELIRDDGLLVEVARRQGADVILRGVRSPGDLEFELQLAQANRSIGGFETIFLPCQSRYGLISSTIVRDCASHGAPIEEMVPEAIAGRIYAAYGVSPGAERME